MKRYLIDLDGTLYRGDSPIDHAADFIRWLEQQKHPYLLVTNCPLRTPEAVAQKLTNMGIAVAPQRVLNSAMVTLEYLQTAWPGARVLLLGSQPFWELLQQNGFMPTWQEDAEVVVVGYDTALTYDQLAVACRAIVAGAALVATNMDNVIPQGTSFVPHTGAVVQLLTYATGVQPVVIGKPMRAMLESAAKWLDCSPQDCIVIGDRLDTDMAFAQNNGIPGYLLLTGCTSREMLVGQEQSNLTVFNHLGEVMEYEKTGGNTYV